MSQQYQLVIVTEDELALSEGSCLSKEQRTEVIQRWKSGQTVTQIQDMMQLKRNNVRKVIDPDYYLPKDKRKHLPISASTADPQTASEVVLDLPKGKGAEPPKERLNQHQQALLSEQTKKYDEDATPENCIADLRRVQEENPLTYINRNVYRHLGKYSDATWNRHFGTFLEFRRQAGLELSRYQHAHERNIAKHASLDHYRQFYTQQIEPINMLYPRSPAAGINTIVCISDNHDRQQDPFVRRVFLEVVKEMQPDVVLFNGDQVDGYEFSRFNIDPRVADAVLALQSARQLFEDARAAAPDSEIVWNLGNHELRLMKHMADASPYMRAVLADFHGWSWADLFKVRDLKININCKWDLAAFNKYDVQEQVKNNWIVFWDTFVAMHTHDDKFGLSGTSGHIHKARLTTSANIARTGTRNAINWTVTPGACRGNADYTDGLDNTDQGFAIFHVMPAEGITIPELVLIQGDFAAVGGRYYYRQPNEVYMPTQTSWV